MGGKDRATAFSDDILNGWDGFADTKVVSDLAIFDGDVEVNANEDAFSVELEVGEGADVV